MLMKVTLSFRFAQDIETNLASDGTRIKGIVQPLVNGHLMASQCRGERNFSSSFKTTLPANWSTASCRLT